MLTTMKLHIPTLIAKAAPIASRIGQILAAAGVRPSPPENTVAMLITSARIYVNCIPPLDRESFLRVAAAAYDQALAERAGGAHVTVKSGPSS